MSSSCAETLALLPGRPLEALEGDERTFVSEHLASCASCRERSAAIEAAYATIHRKPIKTTGPDLVWDRIRAELDRPVVEAAASPPVQVTIALVCCFCHDGVARAEATYCASCLAPHHAECFRAHGRCSAFGCDETRTVRPDIERRPRRPLRIALGLLLVGGVSGAAAFTTYRLSERRHAAELARMRADYDDLIAKIRTELRVASPSIPNIPVHPTAFSQQELATRIDAVFARLEALMRDKNIDELPGAFSELEELLNEYRNQDIDPKQDGALKRWEKRLDEWKEIRLSLKLQIYINLGNEILRVLAGATKAGDLAEGEGAYRKLLEVVATLNAEERDEFHRNAAAFSMRAEALMDELSLCATTLSIDLAQPVPPLVFRAPDGNDWDVSGSDDEQGRRTLTVRCGAKTPARVAFPSRALPFLLAQLEKEVDAAKTAGAKEHAAVVMEVEISTASYGLADAGKERGPFRSSLTSSPGNLNDCGDAANLRIVLAVSDASGAEPPSLVVRMNAAGARKLAEAIKAALAAPRKRTKRVS